VKALKANLRKAGDSGVGSLGYSLKIIVPFLPSVLVLPLRSFGSGLQGYWDFQGTNIYETWSNGSGKLQERARFACEGLNIYMYGSSDRTCPLSDECQPNTSQFTTFLLQLMYRSIIWNRVKLVSNIPPLGWKRYPDCESEMYNLCNWPKGKIRCCGTETSREFLKCTQGFVSVGYCFIDHCVPKSGSRWGDCKWWSRTN